MVMVVVGMVCRYHHTMVPYQRTIPVSVACHKKKIFLVGEDHKRSH